MLRLLTITLLCVSCLSGQDKLPVKRVVLYKNGIGYFEHLGHVQGNQDVGISFRSGQLNDVLKSLTVLDLNGGRISGVAYGSSAPVDRQLSDQESRLESLRREKAQLETKRNAAQEELNRMIQTLSMDVRLS